MMNYKNLSTTNRLLLFNARTYFWYIIWTRSQKLHIIPQKVFILLHKNSNENFHMQYAFFRSN